MTQVKRTKDRGAALPSTRPSGAGVLRGRPQGRLTALLAGIALMAIAAVSLLLFRSVGRAPLAAAPNDVVTGSSLAAAATTAPARAAAAAQGLTALTPPAPQKPAVPRIAVTPQDGVVTLAVAGISDGLAHFYEYESGSKTITFFVLKSADGVLRAAFDACDVCFPFKKGYRQEGDAMVCNNCGNRFPSTSINDVTGGCNPAALARLVAGDRLAIQVFDLEAGAHYF